MNTYVMKSPTYYAVHIQGSKDKVGCVLFNEDEILDFAEKFHMSTKWNARKGILSFSFTDDNPSYCPEYVKIGDVVVAYDDGGIWMVEVWDSEEFERKFTKFD